MADEGAVSVETWNSVYTQFRGEMTGKARRLLSDAKIPASRLAAEDVVHDAFARVLRTPRIAGNPRAYLYAVIRREVEAEVRRYASPARREAAHRFGAAGEPTVPDFSGMVDHRIAVHQALRGLPPQQRAAVWKTKAEGLTQHEAAQDMGRSAGTIATHVARAMASLRLNLVAVWAAVITLMCSLASSVAVRLTDVGSGERNRANRPMPDLGLSSGRRWLWARCFFLSGSTCSARSCPH